MSEKPAKHPQISPPNWNFFNQWAGEIHFFSMAYNLASVANREAAAIRSGHGPDAVAVPSVANREAAAIRSVGMSFSISNNSVANREAAAKVKSSVPRCVQNGGGDP